MNFELWLSMIDYEHMTREQIAEAAWCAASVVEREACELRCAKTPVLIDGHHEYTALKVQAMMMEAVSMRSNA